MYIRVHFIASSFPDEKLDTVWNHWLPVSTAMFCVRTKLAFNCCTRMYNSWRWFKWSHSLNFSAIFIYSAWCVCLSLNKLCEILFKISHKRKIYFKRYKWYRLKTWRVCFVQTSRINVCACRARIEQLPKLTLCSVVQFLGRWPLNKLLRRLPIIVYQCSIYCEGRHRGFRRNRRSENLSWDNNR